VKNKRKGKIDRERERLPTEEPQEGIEHGFDRKDGKIRIKNKKYLERMLSCPEGV